MATRPVSRRGALVSGDGEVAAQPRSFIEPVTSDLAMDSRRMATKALGDDPDWHLGVTLRAI